MLPSNENTSIDNIIGDGNCFFRAISKELFGEERNHERLHAILVEYVQINSKHFQQYLSRRSGTIMEHFNNMQKLGVFGNSTFLQIPVHTFSKITPSTSWQWILYKSKKVLQCNQIHSNLPLQCPENYHIELRNANSNHFDRVIQPRYHLYNYLCVNKLVRQFCCFVFFLYCQVCKCCMMFVFW